MFQPMKLTHVFDTGWGYVARRPDGGVDIVNTEYSTEGPRTEGSYRRLVHNDVTVSLPKAEAEALARFIMGLPIQDQEP